MQNPFEYGRELGPGELADRETEVAEVRDALLGGMKHFLIGPRRYGKSSVHNVGTQEARARGATVMRYNVEAYPSIDDLLTTILADAARLMQGPVEKTAKRIGQVFRALRPNVTYSPLDQSWSASLGVETSSPAVPRLVEVLHGLERLAAKAERRTGLVLDEIQHLVVGGVDGERQVRAAVQEHRHVGYVFAGSDTRLLTAMTSDPGRPFYRLGEVRVLEEIPRPAFLEYLQAGFDALSARVRTEALVTILDEAEDVPYNVQLLAHQCWTTLRDLGRSAALTADRVRETHTAAARRLDPVYTQLWIGLTAPQRRALQAIVREGGGGLFGKAIAARYHLPAAHMQKAIEGLIAKAVCWRQVRAGATRVRLEDPLFGRWVRETVVPPAATP
jgi:uncharacterized protein